jgi:PAS domain S-box-containing protein
MSILDAVPPELGTDTAATPRFTLASVLVIDDEKVVGDTLRALSKAAGFDPVVAPSLKDGVDLLRGRHFQVVIVDFALPGANGTRTIAALKKADPDVEVILVTERVTLKSTLAAFRQGVADVLRKRVDVRQLRPALMRALKTRRGRSDRAGVHALALFRTAPEAIVIFDREGAVRDFNPQAEQVFGRSREQVVGRNLTDFAIPPRLFDVFRRHVETSCREGKDPPNGYLEVAALRKHGEEFPLEVSTAAIKTPRGILLGTFGRDLTDRQEAQKAAQGSESKLQFVFDAVETGVFLIDPETHRIVDANPLALMLVGACRELVIAAKCHKFICPADHGRCPVTDLGQKVDNSERVLMTVTGERLPIIKTVKPAVISGRTLLVESFVDISAHKRAEEALRESEDRYRDLVENSFFLIGTHDAKGRILAGLS